MAACCFFCQAEDGIRDLVRSRGLGDVYKRQGPDIRREIDNGAAIVNYYGHGGGLQWDLVFTNDDIYELNNGNKLPFVISVTCYTAHFDNQEIFGEIFNSIPNKGSIAFFGSSGVTFWPTTANLNQDLFEDIFNNKNYVIGKAINYSKNNQAYGSMISVSYTHLTLPTSDLV